MIAWNATQFCDLLGNCTIYLHEDSTMDQAANSLISHLQINKGGCADKIYFYKEFYGRGSRGLVDPGLFERIRTLNISITIFAFGAHAHEDETVLKFWNYLTELLHSTQITELKNRLNITYVWRTNHPAHINCQNAIEPNNITIDSYPQYNNISIDPHNWSGFNRWDYQSIEKARKLGMKILDMSPLYGRPDSHPVNGDCLHYSISGPIDIFANLLF
jgi:hypothetical protein